MPSATINRRGNAEDCTEGRREIEIRTLPTRLRLCRCCGLIGAMPILKKRNHQTESRLLLESAEPIDLPPAEVNDDAILLQFDKFKPFIAELLNELRAGTTAEP